MDRRDFIRGSAAFVLPLSLGGYTAKAMGLSPMLETLGEIASATDRVLVLIQLAGGNDGLNTVIALDQYAEYNRVRANVTIPENRVIKLTNATGLHPAMTGMKALYDAGRLSIIQGVTYPTPNQSHFRSTDIWMTASNANQYLTDGWAARYLTSQFPDYHPDRYPNASAPDPLAIQISATPSVLLRDDSGPMGVNLQDPDSFYRLIGGSRVDDTDSMPPNTYAGRQITFIRQVQVQSQKYAGVIKTAADKARNMATYPARGQNTLADQLAIVARLIAGGLRTRVYVVSMGGFDTHATQVNAADRTQGTHARLLQRLSDAIKVFQDDIRLLGVENRVIGMTFSEFGRRVNSNIAGGTDHGTAAPQFIFGANVRGGLIGTNPNLTDLTNNNLKMQYDFRDIYASILRQWFGVTNSQYSQVLSREFTQIPIIQTSRTDVTASVVAPQALGLKNYPNPCSSATTIEYTLPKESTVRVEVYDMSGQMLTLAVNARQAAGTYTIPVNVETLPAGTYLYRLYTEQGVSASRMFVAR